MFEGKPPRPEESSSLAQPGEGEALRPVEWAELAGRLSAARELRAAMLRADGEGGASFDPGCARRIAAHREEKDLVNLEASTNGKGIGLTGDSALPASRGGAVRDK
jgi:hypothetical protein